jgi:hypothetical protein
LGEEGKSQGEIRGPGGLSTSCYNLGLSKKLIQAEFQARIKAVFMQCFNLANSLLVQF